MMALIPRYRITKVPKLFLVESVHFLRYLFFWPYGLLYLVLSELLTNGMYFWMQPTER